MKRILLIAGWYLSIIGLLLMIIGGICFLRERAFISRASKAQAVVTELVERTGDQTPIYAPVYVFHDSSGQEQKGYSRVGSSPPSYQVGDKIMVLYDQKTPQDTQIQNFFDMWGWTTILSGLGVVAGVIGVIILLVIRRK